MFSSSEAKDPFQTRQALLIVTTPLANLYCFAPPRAPRRQDLQIPKPVPLAWMKLQRDVIPASSVSGRTGSPRISFPAAGWASKNPLFTNGSKGKTVEGYMPFNCPCAKGTLTGA
jgi:hypothetical protein